MVAVNEGLVVSDVIKYEQAQGYSREAKTVLDGQVLVLGEVCKEDANGKMITAAAAADEVQTITPSIAAALDEVQTITPSVGADVDEVHTITFDAAMSAGELDITIFAPDGSPIPVAVPWTSDWPGTMAAWNAAVTAAATVWAGEASVGAVMTGTATIPVLTFSGVKFTHNPIPNISLADVSETTGPTNATSVRSAAGSGVIAQGTYRLGITDLAGNLQWTPPIAHDAVAADINTALDDAMGGALVVASGGPMSTPANVILTYSGTGYTHLPQEPVQIDYADLVGLDDVSIVRTAVGAGVVRADGTYRLGIVDPSGDLLWTGPIAADANAAAIITALDDATGGAHVVATGGPLSTPADIILTFSGVGYTALAQSYTQIDLSNIRGCDDVSIVRTQAGAVVGADADSIILEASSPSGADGEAVFLVRSAVVITDNLTYETGAKANTVAALKTHGIVAVDAVV